MIPPLEYPDRLEVRYVSDKRLAWQSNELVHGGHKREYYCTHRVMSECLLRLDSVKSCEAIWA